MALFGNGENQTDQQGNDKWRATDFINLYAPAKTLSGRRKVGVLKLKDNPEHPIDQQLVAFCKADEGNAQLFIEGLTAEFRHGVTDVEESGLILPGMGDDTPEPDLAVTA